MALIEEIIELEVRISAIESLLLTNKNLDSYALSAAQKYEINKPEITAKLDKLHQCFNILSTVNNNPDERIKAICDELLRYSRGDESCKN